jgi:P2 family phage contractile tail tube protein
MANLPRILKNLNLFADGFGQAGLIDTMTPPAQALKTEEHRAGGMDAPVEYDMGMEKLELTFTLSDPQEGVIGLFGRPNVQYIARNAIQRYGEEAEPVIITMTGMLKQLDFGSQTPGDKGTYDITATLTYYKLSIAGNDRIELDIPNMIRIVDGVDLLASQRTAIGV